MMKNENFSLTSLICLPQLHHVENFTEPFFGDLREDARNYSVSVSCDYDEIKCFATIRMNRIVL